MSTTGDPEFSLEQFLRGGVPSNVEVELTDRLAKISDQVRWECTKQRNRAASILNEIVGGEPRSTIP